MRLNKDGNKETVCSDFRRVATTDSSQVLQRLEPVASPNLLVASATVERPRALFNRR